MESTLRDIPVWKVLPWKARQLQTPFPIPDSARLRKEHWNERIWEPWVLPLVNCVNWQVS